MSNTRKLRRPQKRSAARAVAAASTCPDCGARARRPRKDHGTWVLDVPHEDSCPARRLPGLRDSMGRDAVRQAQPAVGFPLAYMPSGAAVIAGDPQGG